MVCRRRIATLQVELGPIQSKVSSLQSRISESRASYESTRARLKEIDARLHKTLRVSVSKAPDSDLRPALERLRKAETAYAKIRKQLLPDIQTTTAYRDVLAERTAVETRIEEIRSAEPVDGDALLAACKELTALKDRASSLEFKIVGADEDGKPVVQELNEAKKQVAMLRKEAAGETGVAADADADSDTRGTSRISLSAAPVSDLKGALERLRRAEAAYAKIRKRLLPDIEATSTYREVLAKRADVEERIEEIRSAEPIDGVALLAACKKLTAVKDRTSALELAAVEAHEDGERIVKELKEARKQVAILRKESSDAEEPVAEADPEPEADDEMAELRKERAECAKELARIKREIAPVYSEYNRLLPRQKKLEADIERARKQLARLK
jgi:chromosome segregation ATPase